MESPNLLTKVLTLTLFVVLMSGFVAYRLGAFEHKITRTDLALASHPAVDSPDEKPKLIMSSSKSMGVSEPYVIRGHRADSPVIQQRVNQANKDRTVLPSSKSGPVFRSTDSILQMKQINQQQQSNPH